MATEAPLFTTLKDAVVTFTDGSGTPIVYTFRVPADGIDENTKRIRSDIEALDTNGEVVSVRKSGTIDEHPTVTLTNVRIHNHDLGSTAITATLGSLIAIVRGTGPSGWTNTDSARAPDHVTGTLAITTASVGGADGETRSYAKARIVDISKKEKTDMNGRFLPSIVFKCIDEPTITVNA